MIVMLKIEWDSTMRGCRGAPRPWVARVTDGGREFVQALNDWSTATVTGRGDVRGLTVTYPLRDGEVYEVSRPRGSRSRRYMSREFVGVANGQIKQLEPEDVVLWLEQASTRLA